MASVVDSNLWIDFIRVKSPVKLKRFISPFILAADGVMIEPIKFEVLRFIELGPNPKLQQLFDRLPVLATPLDVWTTAAELGLRCRQAGIGIGSMDLLIATCAIHHQLTLVTFDQDFLKLAALSTLRVNLLQKPATI